MGGYSKFSTFEKMQLSLSVTDAASCLVEPQLMIIYDRAFWIPGEIYDLPPS